ncbi:MAG: T9SS type A sorting domain-containing protein [Ignavibacterium sp.]|jgi:hypothetical protein|nr:T9SS type A sorting domain-containing protein [Ignavibacterium sp.]
MKKVLNYFFVLLFIVSVNGIVSGQNNPIDFETGGFGATWTWTMFENDTNPQVEIIANPDMSGANTSATVAKFTALQTGNPWAGCESQHGADIGTFTLDATNSTVKIMVWKPVISDVGLKFVLPSGEALPEIKVANTVINQWEELTFDFSSRIGHPATIGQDQIVIFPDFDLGGRTQDNVIYFDNITFSAGGGSSTEPTVAAPTPPARDPASVISLFSEAYANVIVDTWRTDWSSALFTDVTIAGNPTKKYSQLDFVGIETVANQLNISNMTHVHIDIWSADFTFFGIKLVDFGADGAFGGGDDVEQQIDFNSPTQGEWVSLDIPLSDFTNLTTRNHIAQYILVGQPTGSNTVYVDNFYFYNSATDVKEIIGATPSDFELEQNYPNPFNPSTLISYSIPQNSFVTLKVYDVIGNEVATLVNQSQSAGKYEVRFDASNLSNGVYMYSIKTDNFTSTKKMILMK